MGYAEIDLIFNSSVYVTFFKLRTLNKDWIYIPIIIEYVNSNIYVNHLLIIDNARCWLKLFFKTPIISMHFCFIFQTVLLLSGTIRSHLDSILKYSYKTCVTQCSTETYVTAAPPTLTHPMVWAHRLQKKLLE